MASTQIQMEMTYWRDIYNGHACLEYSWVPEGHRHTILLNAGQQESRRSDPTSEGLRPSHVQVYVLTNDLHSTEGWQFPPGVPQELLFILAGGSVRCRDGCGQPDNQRCNVI